MSDQYADLGTKNNTPRTDALCVNLKGIPAELAAIQLIDHAAALEGELDEARVTLDRAMDLSERAVSELEASRVYARLREDLLRNALTVIRALTKGEDGTHALPALEQVAQARAFERETMAFLSSPHSQDVDTLIEGVAYAPRAVVPKLGAVAPDWTDEDLASLHEALQSCHTSAFLDGAKLKPHNAKHDRKFIYDTTVEADQLVKEVIAFRAAAPAPQEEYPGDPDDPEGHARLVRAGKLAPIFPEGELFTPPGRQDP